MKLVITSNRRSKTSVLGQGSVDNSEFITEIECEDSVDFGTTVVDLHKLHEQFHFSPESKEPQPTE